MPACWPGAQLSRGDRDARFRHNDVDHRARIACASTAPRHDHALIVTDGVFSMDGDLAPLADLTTLGDANTTPG